MVSSPLVFCYILSPFLTAFGAVLIKGANLSLALPLHVAGESCASLKEEEKSFHLENDHIGKKRLGREPELLPAAGSQAQVEQLAEN